MASPNEMRLADIAARGGQEQYEFDKFKAMTGRSDKNPYGDAGRFGSNADYSGIMSAQQINDVNRIAFEQAKGLQSGRGFQGRGMGAPQQGYAPALKIGERIPGGTVAAANPEASGLGSFLKGGGFLGALLGGGNRPRKFVPADRVEPFNPGTGPYDKDRMIEINQPLVNPVREIGGSFDVPIMEQIANPGGQAYEAPVADMVDMTLPTPPPENIAEMVSTRGAVDDAVASMRQALDRNYSPVPADVTRENIMDAILANQIRNRNARNVENLVGAAAADSQIRQAAADSLANQEDMAEKARRMQEINNPPGDPLIELPPGMGAIDDFDMLTLGATPSPTTAPAIPPASTLYETNFGIMSAEDIANMTPMERSQLSFIDDVQFVVDELAAGRRGLPTIR